MDTSFRIRDFQQSDYGALATIMETVAPGRGLSAAVLEHFEKAMPGKCFRRRWMVEIPGEGVNGQVAYGHVGHVAHAYDPHGFHISIRVLPEYRGRGIASALYERCLDAVAPLGPRRFTSDAVGADPRNLSFLAKRGFVEVNRRWASHLELDAATTARFAALVQDEERRLRAQGITLTTLRELGRSISVDRQLYALETEVGTDIPMMGEHPPLGFEEFVKSTLEAPAIAPEAFLIAQVRGEFIGYTLLLRDEGSELAAIGMTGVKRAWRAQGLARALKIASIRKASALGIKRLRTMNDASNTPIVTLNDKLGFVRQSETVEFEKKL